MSFKNTFNWYVAYTRPMAERKVAELFARKNLQHYIPLNRVHRNGYDISSATIKPLFPSYVFVRIEADKYESLKSIRGVMTIMNWRGSAAIISPEEIDALRRFIDLHSNVFLEKIQVNVEESANLIHTHTPVLNEDGEAIEVLAPSSSRLLLPSLGYALTSQSRKEVSNGKSILVPVNKGLFTRVKDMVG